MRRTAPLLGFALLAVAAGCSSVGADMPDAAATRRSSIDTLHAALVKSSGIGETELLRTAHEQAIAALDAGSSDDAFVRGAWRVLVAARVGHSGMYDLDAPGTCDPAVGRPRVSGVRTTAAAKGFVVTKTSMNEVLGLELGDVIVAIGDARGTDAMTDLVLTFPVCASLSPSPTGRRAQASHYWTSVIPAGTPIEIETSPGTRRTLVFPALPVYEPPAESGTSEDDDPPPEVTLRADGVAVVRVPGFSIGHRVLAEAIDQASTAKAVVIDVRDNPGGYPALAQELAAALPGARESVLLTCGTPEARAEQQYGPASLDASGRTTPLTKLRAPTAVLVNGSTYSAASLFTRLAALGTDAKLVGVADAGAYSNGHRRLELAGPPRLVVTFDDTRCYDLAGVPVEGAPPEPFMPVDVAPADVARGFDTQLEAAVQLVLAPR